MRKGGKFRHVSFFNIFSGQDAFIILISKVEFRQGEKEKKNVFLEMERKKSGPSI